MLELVFNRNCVYQTAYHVVWCPKYRRSVLTGAVADSLRLLLTEVCNENGWVILSLEIQPDHIHLFVSIPPSKAVGNYGTQVIPSAPRFEKTTSGWTSLVSILLCRLSWQGQRRNDKAVH